MGVRSLVEGKLYSNSDRWKTTVIWQFPYFQCSVGCGKGYSSRQLVCTLNGKSVNELICSNQPKPQDSLTKHCETFNECRWKTGEWKQCSCTGYTKRRVQCFDLKMNRQSNSCPEQTKPELKKRCDQPPNCKFIEKELLIPEACHMNATNSINCTLPYLKCFISNSANFVTGSCKGLQRSQRIYQDADYPLLVRGRKVHIYCQGMNTTNPKEYITLKGNIQLWHMLLLLFLKKKKNYFPKMP